MAFQQGLSGLNASSKALDVISNNVANASTVGFKAAQAHFADIYANSLNGSGANQIGIGVNIAAVQQGFNQGNITTTTNPLDIAINGNGFFQVKNSGNLTYTRNGQFHADKDYYIVNDQGYRLQGWQPTPTGTVVPGTPSDLRVDKSNQPAQATGASALGTGVQAKLNLDSRSDVPTVTPFNPANPDSYNFSTAVTIYDSRGNPHNVTYYFVKSNTPGPANGGEWTVQGQADGVPNSISGVPFTIDFDTTGQLSGFTAPTLTVNLATIEAATGKTFGANNPAFKMDLSRTTSFGSSSTTNSLVQDGYPPGQLTGISVSPEGMLQGRYSNGQTKNMGMVVLYDFANPNGLQSLGNNQWAETYGSGQAVIGQPSAGNFGVLQSGSVEESTVDLTTELVTMITQQRNYQANAQSVKTQDQILQTLVNLR